MQIKKLGKLRLPLMAAPMFIVSGIELVKAQCSSGIVGSFPALNARSSGEFHDWVVEIKSYIGSGGFLKNSNGCEKFAVNIIVHKSNDRVDRDLRTCVDLKVPIVITSMGIRRDVIDAVHGYGGIVLHDVTNKKFSMKAAEYGVDGLIAVCAGAGGHAGTISPFAMLQELRTWYDGLLLLSGSVSTGNAILAAQILGADLAYAGSLFIATVEANATEEYKNMIVEGGAEDIVYTPLFSGVRANYLKESIRVAGLDPDNLPSAIPEVNYSMGRPPKAWKDIWGAGQGIGAVNAIAPTRSVIDRLEFEYRTTRTKIMNEWCPA